MTDEMLYTTKDVAKILSISDYRPKEGVKRGILVPTRIRENVGRHGQYLFNADAIRAYAAVLKITPSFSVVGNYAEDAKNVDGSINLTPENFENVVHGDTKVTGEWETVEATDKKDLGSNKDIWNMFQKDYDMSLRSLSNILDVQSQSIRNKINRDSPINIDQLVDICTAANLEIKIGDRTINPKKWYADDPAKYERLDGYMTKRKEEAYKEYEAAKARVAELEKELGIK